MWYDSFMPYYLRRHIRETILTGICCFTMNYFMESFTVLLLALFLTAAAQTAQTASPTSPSLNNGLQFSSNVTQVQPSVTKNMVVECSRNASVGLNVSLVSLTILQWNEAKKDFEDLVSINVFNPRTVNTLRDVGAKVVGWMNSQGRAYLSLRWDYPGQQQAGRYVCTANTLDKAGHSDSIQLSLKIDLVNTDVSMLTDAVRTLKEDVLNLTNTVSSLNYDVERYKSDKDYLWKQYYELSGKVKDMQYNVFHESSVTISGLKVFWSKSSYYSFDAAQAMCTLIGGKLAELNPNTIASKSRDLKNDGYNHWAWLGAMYINGSMIYPSTGQKVNFSLGSKPDTDPSCTIVNPDITHLYTVPCTRHESYRAFCTVG